MTKDQIKSTVTAYIAVIKDIGEIIKLHGEEGIPSGHLYARLMASMSLDTYTGIIGILKDSGSIIEQGYLLKWNMK